MNDKFRILHKLGFTTDNGLVHNLEEALNNVERLYIEEVKKLGADAVFFRRKYAKDAFEKEAQPTPIDSTPTVCIFKKTADFFNSNNHKTLHAALWSAGRTEVYILQSDNRIDIINARKPAKRTNNNDVTLEDEDLNLIPIGTALKTFNDQRFSAHLFGSGTFWEQSEFQEKIDGNSSPYVFLLDYLMQVRKILSLKKTVKKKNKTANQQLQINLEGAQALDLEALTIDKLLITCILIKFLEGIKDDNGKHTLQKIYKKHKIHSFSEGLEQGKCIAILDELANEFNGKIFDTFTEDEKKYIAQTNLNPIAQFLQANIDIATQQFFIWKQYSFKHLPAEVISAIYENFIHAEASRTGKTDKGVVYTPIHLVNLMIDEVMPLDKPELFKNKQFKVLDPACGSGVFLVAAYKRMLQWWTINYYRRTGKIKYPNKKVAQEILEKNIFGVDVVETAVLVSIFGLTTAFLDKLTPKEIWNNLKFSELRGMNIQKANFADWAKLAKKEEKKFDLVIGNPPFNDSLLGTITQKDAEELFNVKVPRNKLALKFLEAGLYFGKKVCMIIPSNVFLYNKANVTQDYRNRIFTNFTVKRIYDFTHLRETLFVKKNLKGFGSKKKMGRTPVVAIIIDKQPSEYQSIEHIILKRQLLSDKKLRFEIDYYDRHQVRWDWATNEKMRMVWKTNLLGGGQLFHLIYRLSLLEKLKNFIGKKKKEKDWDYSNGYITQYGNIEDNEKATFLNNKPRIKPKTFDEYGNYETIIIPETEYFWNKRTANLFKPPLIVFKLVLEESKIPMAFVNEYLCFNSSFVGISAPFADKKSLYEVYNRLFKDKVISNLYRAFILATSPKAVVYHETSIIKDDIDNLPYPKNTEYLIPSPPETILINDVLKYYRHLGKAISKNSAGAILHQAATSDDLKAFGKTYCDALNDIYAEDGKSWQSGEIIQAPMFIAYQFGFGKDDGLKATARTGLDEEILSLLEETEGNAGVIHKRIIRTYQHIDGYDCVYFIKPHTKRYWLQSIALRDADDTFMDLKNAGY